MNAGPFTQTGAACHPRGASAIGLFVRLLWATAVGTVLIASPGCDKINEKAVQVQGARYERAIQSGVREPLYPGQFNRLFPGAQNIISYYTGQIGKTSWASSVGLFGRYVLKMRVPVELDRARTEIVSTGVPTFILYEFREINFRRDGAPVVKGRQMTTFSRDEWQRLVREKGDFSALGIILQTNKPVNNFEAAWRRF